MGPVSIGVEVQRNTDGDTPSSTCIAGMTTGTCNNLYPFYNILYHIHIHLIKVISERFQSHFSEYVLMTLKRFLPIFVHLHGQQFSDVLEKIS